MMYNNIHLVHAGEGNIKIYSPKSNIFSDCLVYGRNENNIYSTTVISLLITMISHVKAINRISKKT